MQYKAPNEKIDLLGLIADIKKLPRIKSLDELIGYRPGKWLNERPKSIQNYVRALCGLKNENCGLKVIKAALVM